MSEYAEREEMETFIIDSAVPDGDKYVLRSGSIADTLWDAGYRKQATP